MEENQVAQPLTRPTSSKAKSVRRLARSIAVDDARVAGKSDALVRRLRKKAAGADAGKTIDTTGMTDDQFIDLLRR